MSKNILFIHSGGFWKDYTFKKAKELGYNVFLAQKNYTKTNPHISKVIDADAYNYEVILKDLEKSRKEINGVTTFFELAVESTALVAEKWKLPGNPFEAAQRSRDKYLMRETFKKAGVPSVDAFALVESVDDVKGFGRSNGYPIILKPTKFGAAAGVVRINKEDDINRLFNFVKTETESFCTAYNFPKSQTHLMAETMIDPKATEANVDLIIHNKEPLVISVAEKPQDTTGPTFQENDYVMPPVNISDTQLEIIKKIAVNAVKSLGLKYGAAHLESKVSLGKKFDCRVVEVGARCGGDLEVPAVKTSTGIDLSEIVIKQAMGDFSDADFEALKNKVRNNKPQPVGIQVLYAPKNGTIKNIHVPDEVRNDPRFLEMKFEYRPGDKITMHYSDYVGAIMVKGSSPKAALQAVNKFISQMTVEMA